MKEIKLNSKLIKERKWREVKSFLEKLAPPAVADLLINLDKSEALVVFRLLPSDFAALVFSYLDQFQKDELIKNLHDKEKQQLLAELTPDDRTELFSDLPAVVTSRLLELLSPQDFKETSFLLGYPEDSVGRIMTPEYVAVQKDWPVSKVLKYIREHGKDSETVNMIYVVNKQGKLINDIKLRYIITASPKKKIKDLCSSSFVSLSAFDKQEDAIQLIKRYDLVALPVVDSNGILLGIVTIDDLIDVQDDVVTEDIYKGAGIQIASEDLPYFENIKKISVSMLYKHRISWLLILIFVNLFSGAALTYFEEIIKTNIVLVFFLPLLIDSGGNAGSQAATLAIRSLATGDVSLRDWFNLFSKEIFVAAFLGLTMALAVSLVGYARGGWHIALITLLTMQCVIIFSSLIGISLPFIFTKLKLDPAIASAPIISSLADIVGVIIYFSIATMVFKFI